MDMLQLDKITQFRKLSDQEIDAMTKKLDSNDRLVLEAMIHAFINTYLSVNTSQSPSRWEQTTLNSIINSFFNERQSFPTKNIDPKDRNQLSPQKIVSNNDVKTIFANLLINVFNRESVEQAGTNWDIVFKDELEGFLVSQNLITEIPNFDSETTQQEGSSTTQV